ncbi:hypothetical protein D3Z58_12770 [Clostridiaceae bacterium]|nr:hypothetical protein [Clostridiaceae bacterium]
MCPAARSECRLHGWRRLRRLLTTRGIRQPYIYFCTLTVSREDVRAFMAARPEYTKANRFKDIVVKVYI